MIIVSLYANRKCRGYEVNIAIETLSGQSGPVSTSGLR